MSDNPVAYRKRIVLVAQMTDDELASELRSSLRASLGAESFNLIICEALARLLERAKEAPNAQ